jgi:hypothetical protein
MADELAATYALGNRLSGGAFRMRIRKTPDHLQNVCHLIYLRKRRIIDDKWNRMIYQVLFMNLKPRICLMLPLPRPPKIPAELPLPILDVVRRDLPILDVVRRDDGEFVGTELTESEVEEIEVHELASWAKAECLPASPTAGTSSRIPTTSSDSSWEVHDSPASSPVAKCKSLLAGLDSVVKRDHRPYLPLSHWEGLGYPSETIVKGWTSAKTIPGHGVCYQYYIGDDASMDAARLLGISTWQTPSSSSTQLPMFKAAPTPPLNPHPVITDPKHPPVKLAPKQPPLNPHPVITDPKHPPVKLAPKQPPLNPHSPPPPTKSAPVLQIALTPPQSMEPPAKAAPDYAPTPMPAQMWKKKTVREVKCEKCGHGNILHQFM